MSCLYIQTLAEALSHTFLPVFATTCLVELSCLTHEFPPPLLSHDQLPACTPALKRLSNNLVCNLTAELLWVFSIYILTYCMLKCWHGVFVDCR